MKLLNKIFIFSLFLFLLSGCNKQIQQSKKIIINDEFSKDGDGMYQSHNCLSEEYLNSLDPASFEVVNRCFIKDKYTVYYRPYCGQDCIYEKYEEADPRTLVDLGNGFLKDKNFVYYSYNVNSDDKIIDGADSNTFELISEKYSKDNINVYYEDIVVTDADNKTIEVIDKNNLKDINATFVCASDIHGPRCEKK